MTTKPLCSVLETLCICQVRRNRRRWKSLCTATTGNSSNVKKNGWCLWQLFLTSIQDLGWTDYIHDSKIKNEMLELNCLIGSRDYGELMLSGQEVSQSITQKVKRRRKKIQCPLTVRMERSIKYATARVSSLRRRTFSPNPDSDRTWK